MEARRFFNRIFCVTFFCVTLFSFVSLLYSSQYETSNFIVSGEFSFEQARKYCETAENYRRELSLLWLGEELPAWTSKFPITIRVGDNLGAGGSTTFIFQGDIVHGEMNIQGSEKRILDSVLPHEISHTIFATYFKTPIPRWLDEGAATCVEHHSEKENYRQMILYFLQKDVRKCLPFNRMTTLKEYPEDILPFYAQGYSVAEYLITVGGHQLLIKFAGTAIETGDWNFALNKHYGIANLGELQKNYWLEWVAIGSPVLLQQVPENLRLPINKNKYNKAASATNNSTNNNKNLLADYQNFNPNSEQHQNRIDRTAPPEPVILAAYTNEQQTKMNSTVTKIPASFTESPNSVIPIPVNYRSPYEILAAGGEPTSTTIKSY
ncbi:MAG: hypothetical protein LBE18_02355 [Planctomycetaceae bacterium]|jgi:hypothetical protein|nr:hypothetical protein [Planctomycetaceae bacterium]